MAQTKKTTNLPTNPTPNDKMVECRQKRSSLKKNNNYTNKKCNPFLSHTGSRSQFYHGSVMESTWKYITIWCIFVETTRFEPHWNNVYIHVEYKPYAYWNQWTCGIFSHLNGTNVQSNETDISTDSLFPLGLWLIRLLFLLGLCKRIWTHQTQGPSNPLPKLIIIHICNTPQNLLMGYKNKKIIHKVFTNKPWWIVCTLAFKNSNRLMGFKLAWFIRS